MTVKELKEILSYYSDDAEILVSTSINTDEFYDYIPACYDTYVEGDKDIKWDWYDRERSSESKIVRIKVYR